MASDATEAPERVGRYEILLPIAKGGMATVYLARAEGHGGFDRYVALKLTLPHLREDPDFAAHLVDEAKLVAHIRHTHVVPVLDVGEDALGVFLVMEYVAGDSLSGLIRLASKTDTPLPARVALRILVDALDGLHAAHEHRDEDGGPLDVVHRDFSPQNILVGTDGVARLADFGIAKAASRASTTAAGTIKGKMRYLSPEQARGAPLDRRCDLWAAGVVAWEILCGRRLNTGKSDAQAILATFDEVPRVRSIVPDAPQAIDDLIARLLQLDPADRPATADVVARDLEEAARAAGMLAESHEVAAHVARLVGPKLAERKALLAAARRSRLGSSPDLAAAAPPAPQPAQPTTETLAGAELTVPMEVDALTVMNAPPEEGSARSLEVPRAVPAELGSLGLLDVPSAPEAAESQPHLVMPLFGEPARAPRDKREQGTTPATLGLASLLGDRRTLAIIAAVAGVVVLLGMVVMAASARDVTAAADAESAVRVGAMADASASVAVSAPADAGAPTEPAPSPAAASEVAGAQFLELKANAAVADVRIGDRFVDMVIPAPNVNVELTPEEAARSLQITARSTDGRVATLELKRGELAGALVFGASPPRPAAAAPARSTSPATPNRPGAKPVPKGASVPPASPTRPPRR